MHFVVFCIEYQISLKWKENNPISLLDTEEPRAGRWLNEQCSVNRVFPYNFMGFFFEQDRMHISYDISGSAAR